VALPLCSVPVLEAVPQPFPMMVEEWGFRCGW
jgi:hypothetical protein